MLLILKFASNALLANLLARSKPSSVLSEDTVLISTNARIAISASRNVLLEPAIVLLRSHTFIPAMSKQNGLRCLLCLLQINPHDRLRLQKRSM